MAWLNQVGGGTVRLQRYNSDGTSLGAVLSTSNLMTNPNAIQGIVLKPLTDGGFALAFSGQSNSPADSDIHVRKYDASGNTNASVIRLGTTLSPDQAPNMFVGPSGTFTVSWRGRTSGVDEVWTQNFLADGQTSGSSVKLLSTSGYFGVPIAMFPNGDFVTVIAKANDISVTRNSSTGVATFTTQLTGISGGVDTQPVVAVTTDGGYAVAWLGDNTISGTSQAYDVWVQRFDSNNTVVGSKVALSGLAGNFSDSSVVISALSDNRFAVAWAGRTGSNTNEEDVFVQVFDAAGNPFGTKQQLGTPLVSRDHAPKITALSNGNFVVAWEGQTADSQGYDIFSRLFTPGNIIVDSVAPSTSLSDVVVDLKNTSDAGISDSDNLTNVVRPTVTVNLTGKSLVAGDLVQVINASASDAVVGSYTVTSADAQNGIGSLDITLSTILSSGANDLKVRLGDLAGNFGSASTTATTVTIDTTVPTLTWNSVSETGFTFTAADTGPTTLTVRIDSTALPVTVANGATTTYNVAEMPSVLLGQLNVMDSAGNISALPNHGTVLYVVLGDTSDQTYTFGGNNTFAAYGFGGGDYFKTTGWGDYIFGGGGNDVLQGEGGNDFILGGDGNDNIWGGLGNDTLRGNDGVDILLGGAGNDALEGGIGNDYFRFESSSNSDADTVADFSTSDDLIQLARSALTALAGTGTVPLSSDEFASGAGLTAGQDASDRIVYNTTNGSLYYDADGSGAGAAVLLATFTGAPTLTVAHFSVI
jgi:Ca2+-binding RTX toxin-like protein